LQTNKSCIAETPQLPHNYQEETWKKLEEAVVAMQTSKSIQYSQEELFQGVENMCNHKMAQFLYTNLKSMFYKCIIKDNTYILNIAALTEKHVEANVKPFLAESIDRQIFLKRMNECWLAHCRQMIQIRSIFLYLDRTYVLQNASIVSIW